MSHIGLTGTRYSSLSVAEQGSETVPGSAAMFDGRCEVALNERGYPKLLADEADHPGPYCIGFGNPPTGLLREINHQAKAVAAKIAAANHQ